MEQHDWRARGTTWMWAWIVWSLPPNARVRLNQAERDHFREHFECMCKCGGVAVGEGNSQPRPWIVIIIIRRTWVGFASGKCTCPRVCKEWQHRWLPKPFRQNGEPRRNHMEHHDQWPCTTWMWEWGSRDRSARVWWSLTGVHFCRSVIRMQPFRPPWWRL